MRRFYVVPKSVWLGGANLSLYHPGVGSHYIDLVPSGVDPTTHVEILAAMIADGHDLDTHEGLSNAFDAAVPDNSNYVLVSTDFASEGHEDLWHGHPHVGILPHATFEGNVPIQDCVGCPTKHITEDHLAALAAHPALGFESHHSVLDLGARSVLLHPQVRLRPIL